jgi:hypothetical protein
MTVARRRGWETWSSQAPPRQGPESEGLRMRGRRRTAGVRVCGATGGAAACGVRARGDMRIGVRLAA